jgi:hypothetical protein
MWSWCYCTVHGKGWEEWAAGTWVLGTVRWRIIGGIEIMRFKWDDGKSRRRNTKQNRRRKRERESSNKNMNEKKIVFNG